MHEHHHRAKRFMASVLLLAGVIVAAFVWTLVSQRTDEALPVVEPPVAEAKP